MAHVDEHIQGRMLAEVFELLMLEDVAGEERYLAFEVDNHRSFGVRPEMYAPLLDAVRDVVREHAAAAWDEATAAAWERQLARLAAAIEAHARG